MNIPEDSPLKQETTYGIRVDCGHEYDPEPELGYSHCLTGDDAGNTWYANCPGYIWTESPALAALVDAVQIFRDPCVTCDLDDNLGFCTCTNYQYNLDQVDDALSALTNDQTEGR